MEKTYYRNIYRALRDQIPAELRNLYSLKTFSHIRTSSIYNLSDSIFIFVSMDSEIQTIDWIPKMLEDSKNVYIPYVEKNNPIMYMTQIYSLNELEENYMGILQVPEKYLKERIRNKVDLVITPGLVFDDQGYRIGYGGGFYDRFFSSTEYKNAYGVGFSLQRKNSLPHNKHDQPVEGFFSQDGLELFS